MNPAVSMHKCEDGTPFPVLWETPEDAESRWVWNGSHSPLPLPPLDVALYHAGGKARTRAFEEAGLECPPFLRRWIFPNGFAFLDPRPLEDAEQASNSGLVRNLLGEHGSDRAIWERLLRPCVRAACESLRIADAAISLLSLADLAWYAYQQTFVAVVACFGSLNLLVRLCIDEFGTRGEALGHELCSGYGSTTLAVDEELWSLAHLADQSPAVRALLLDTQPVGLLAALGQSADAAPFLTALQGFLGRHGTRSEGWDLNGVTWIERPTTPLTMVREILRSGASTPADASEAAAQRRDALIRETEALLDGEERRARFRQAVQAAADHVFIREDRAYWQMMAMGHLRLALLRHGSRLVHAGSLADAEDVLFLLPEEVEGQTGEPGLASRAAERRAVWQQWAGKRPPTTIGGETSPIADPGANDTRNLRGIGASRGQITGWARILSDPAEGERLKPGDVLVCFMTSPAWTPLFGIASAVVTESGGLLSHSAIAAREYGIPCVVGVRGATERIPDGAMISVDGSAGTVTLLG